ncbi:SPOR domain-containing protein [Cohnella sp.]|uniref:SPOR domain-containing protein n=1 Tax=Cohnella sp. TaxID=1883426 RepID=UPI003564A762
MPSNARMTIRFEPPVKPKQKPTEMPAAPKAEPIDITPTSKEELPAAPTVFEAWDSPYQDDIRALEEIIRKSDSNKEPLLSDKAFSSRPKPRRDRNDLQDITVSEWLEDKWAEAGDGPADGYGDGKTFGSGNGWYDAITTTEIVRERGPSWTRVVLSVAGAIATGVLFGYMVLGLFTGEPLFPNQSAGGTAAIPAQASAAPGSAEPSGGRESAAGGASEATAPKSGGASAPAITEVAADRYYVLQYGVFNNEESMEVAAGQLQSKGYSWGTDASDGYRVYAAAALTKEEAELLAAQMTGLEVYIKPVGGAALKVGLGALTAEGAEFIDAGAAMIRELVRVSGAGLLERQPSALSDKRLADWQAAQQRWRKAAAYEGAWGSEAAGEAAAIAQAMKAGETAMAEYAKEPSRKQLWNMQTAAMKALLADHRLRAALDPNG